MSSVLSTTAPRHPALAMSARVVHILVMIDTVGPQHEPTAANTALPFRAFVPLPPERRTSGLVWNVELMTGKVLW